MFTNNWFSRLFYALTRSRLHLLNLVILLGLLSLAPVRADGPHRVGLVVVHGDTVIKKCVEFSEDQLNGYEVLERSGLDLNADVTNGMGATICRIDHTGCTCPQEQCFCQCQGSPCIFWSYWHLHNNEWQFSSLGASNYQVGDGEVEGWQWGEGTPNRNGSPPPVIPFEQICAEPPTATPVPPTHTPTPTPTHTPTTTLEPTATPKPTATATPLPTPIIYHFTATQSAITTGQSVTLNWDLAQAEAAFLRYDGLEEGVVSPGSKTISPAKTTVYTLVSRNNSGEVKAEVTITVNAPAPTISTSIAPNTSTPTFTPAPIVPAATVTPTPVIHFSASASTLPVGACVSLQWDAPQVGQVYLDEVEVNAQGSQPACPTQSRAYTLRVMYPDGGARAVQLALQVITDPPQPDFLAAPAPTAAPTNLPTITPTATPAATALAALQPARRAPTHAVISKQEGNDRAGSHWLAYGGLAAITGLFVVAPLGLLLLGAAVWWLRRRP